MAVHAAVALERTCIKNEFCPPAGWHLSSRSASSCVRPSKQAQSMSPTAIPAASVTEHTPKFPFTSEICVAISAGHSVPGQVNLRCRMLPKNIISTSKCSRKKCITMAHPGCIEHDPSLKLQSHGAQPVMGDIGLQKSYSDVPLSSDKVKVKVLT